MPPSKSHKEFVSVPSAMWYQIVSNHTWSFMDIQLEDMSQHNKQFYLCKKDIMVQNEKNLV